MEAGFAVSGLTIDSDLVMELYRKQREKLLKDIGSHIRQTARRSIRKRKKSSPVGSPPSSHLGFLRDLIIFAVDKSAGSVVVGPVKGSRGSAVARLLEKGGLLTKTKKGKTKTLRYRPHPFMAPALAANTSSFSDMLRNMLKK